MGNTQLDKGKWIRRKCDKSMARKRGKKCTKMSSKCDTCFCSMYFRDKAYEWVHYPCGSDNYFLTPHPTGERVKSKPYKRRIK